MAMDSPVPVMVSASTSLDMSASFNSDPIYVGYATMGSVQMHIGSGDAAGTLKIQRSNNRAERADGYPDGLNPASGWDWTDWVGMTATVTATSDTDGTSPFDFDLTSISCRWIRVVWTRTGGSCTATGNASLKGSR